MKTRFLALLLAFTHTAVFAELKWDHQRVEITAGPTDPTVEATFVFVNAGSDPVTIERLQTSCGCTTAELPKMTFAPGEKSQLVAKFDIAGRRGVQTKTVTLHLKGESTPVVLELVVSIPDLLAINPPLVAWEKGEVATPKTISLKSMSGLPVSVVKVGSSDPNVNARLETISEGKEYKIIVTPSATATPGFSVLTVDTEFKDQKKSLRAYVQVREPRR